MAKCKAIAKPEYQLDLTNEEAQVLRDILMFVGGSPTESRRGLADTIASALQRAAGSAYESNSKYIDIQGGISFRNS